MSRAELFALALIPRWRGRAAGRLAKEYRYGSWTIEKTPSSLKEQTVMRMLLASVLVLGLSACGSSVQPDWTLQVTKVDRFAGCTPIAHLKNNAKATTNNIEVELTVGGMKQLAVFENVRAGQTQDTDLGNLVTKQQPCSAFPADTKVTAVPHCLVNGKRFTADQCLAALKTEATMPDAVPVAK